MDNKARLTREEIYEMVWSRPLSTIAKEYLISDVGLRKLCRRMDIPLPKQGHWLRQRFKKDGNRIPLTKNSSVAQSVELQLKSGNNIRAATSLEVQLQKTIEQDLIDELSVSSEINNLDPIILSAKKSLERRDKYYREGTLLYAGELGISVGPMSVNRALLITDALVRGLRKRGHILLKQKLSTFIVGEEEIHFTLKETQSKVLVNDGGWERMEYRPNGVLVLKFEASLMTTSVKDGKATIESQLSKIIARVELLSTRLKKARLEREEWRRKYEEQRRLEDELKNKKLNELHGVKQLLQDARRWDDCGILRDYINEVELKAIEKNQLTDVLQNWLNWARQKADWYDPLVELEDEWLKDYDKGSLLPENKIIASQSQTTWGRYTSENKDPTWPLPWYKRK